MLKCWKWAGKGTKRLLKSGDSKVTLLALRSAVRKLGFKSEGIVLSVKELSSVMLPVILHLRSEHYVVKTGLKQKCLSVLLKGIFV